jgi:hypothetical protein
MMNAPAHRASPQGAARRRQRGALSIVTGFALVALIGMLAVVLDLGHLYIAKTELQNAADACALSAAGELATIDAATYGRATTAGIAVGERNKSDMQRLATNIVAADISFSSTFAGPYSNAIAADTRYARCAPQLTNVTSIAMWFAGVFNVSSVRMAADAIARVDHKVDTCALPLAMCTNNEGAANLGFTIGQWTSGRLSAGSAQTGNYDWIDFKGVLGTKLSDTLAGTGQCDLPPGIAAVTAQKGVTGAAEAWNTRFGLYAGSYKDPALYKTDTTGFAYTAISWPLGKLAFSDQYAKNYVAQEAANAPYDPSAVVDKKGNPVNFPGNPSPSSKAVHAAGTPGRRITVMPVMRCGDWDPNGKDEPVVGWVCALMLAPISDPNTDVRMEVIRVTAAPDQQPCDNVPGVGGVTIEKLVR